MREAKNEGQIQSSLSGATAGVFLPRNLKSRFDIRFWIPRLVYRSRSVNENIELERRGQCNGVLCPLDLEKVGHVLIWMQSWKYEGRRS